jgi:hypothetical protein
VPEVERRGGAEVPVEPARDPADRSPQRRVGVVLRAEVEPPGRADVEIRAGDAAAQIARVDEDAVAGDDDPLARGGREAGVGRLGSVPSCACRTNACVRVDTLLAASSPPMLAPFAP